MITLRPSNARGHADFGWLDSRHTFSFGEYYNSNHMGFGPLRVINEDHVAAGGGFDTHPHRNMEIISYVLQGAMEHKDSIGNGSIIRPGDVQIMGAGTGVRHSEFNHSQSEGVHFFQIWIMPEQENLSPRYDQKNFGNQHQNTLCLVASKAARNGSLKINQDTDLYASISTKGTKLVHNFAAGRLGWLQIASGTLTLSGTQMQAGDGAAISDLETIEIEVNSDAEFLLFDMINT